MNSPINVNQIKRYYHYYHKNGYFFGGHTHPSWEVNIVAKGILEITYDDKIITLGENMMMVCEPDIFHRNRVLSDEGTELYVFQFYTDDIPRSNNARIYTLDNPVFLSILEQEIEKQAESIGNGSCMCKKFSYQAEKLFEILLIRHIYEKEISNYEKNPDEVLYNKAINYMKENINRNICVDEIAHHCGIGSTKLKEMFKNHTGNGVIKHFSDMKINYAKKLLCNGKSVYEVSNILGYSSQAYFSMCFKKNTGITPIKFKYK